ncbi:hypothetical protein [Aureimonas psammosilenae]|uniref:hypothetical protein n=1 Tax=Aureimonas psammosilenae TaxID=2495496 RepID=UPI0012608945|nr:hypothetical protein [Aureimonas psammosilenae]
MRIPIATITPPEFDPRADLAKHRERQEHIRNLAEQARESDRPGLGEALDRTADKEQAIRESQEAGRNSGRALQKAQENRSDDQRASLTRESREHFVAAQEAQQRADEAQADLNENPYADEAKEVIDGREIEQGPEQALHREQEQEAERRPSETETKDARHTMATVSPFSKNGINEEGLKARIEAYKTLQRSDEATKADQSRKTDDPSKGDPAYEPKKDGPKQGGQGGASVSQGPGSSKDNPRFTRQEAHEKHKTEAAGQTWTPKPRVQNTQVSEAEMSRRQQSAQQMAAKPATPSVTPSMPGQDDQKKRGMSR